MDDDFPRWLVALIGTLLAVSMFGLTAAVLLISLRCTQMAERIAEKSAILALSGIGLGVLSGLFYLWRWVLS